MNSQSLPVFKDISFNPRPIESYVPMEPLHPTVFDHFCEDGWVYWSDLIFRRNFWEWRGKPCRVVMLRIDLKKFTYSKSQKKCLRRNSDLRVFVRPLQICREHIDLFEKHASRFGHNRPESINGFFSRFSHEMPCFGLEFDVFTWDKKLIAASFAHVGTKSVAGNYSVFDSDFSQRSLGTYTMLLEIEYARRAGRRYYYPGFVYDLPSEFDYKLNFNALEYFDWWGNWYPLERMPVRDWRSEWGEKMQVKDFVF